MEIDVSGTVCPQTVLVVRRCLEELEPGDVLTVHGDYPPAERSIRRACYKHGYRVSPGPSTESDDEFSLQIHVTRAAADDSGGIEDTA